jgi:hypothetical protein
MGCVPAQGGVKGDMAAGSQAAMASAGRPATAKMEITGLMAINKIIYLTRLAILQAYESSE